VRSVTSQLRIVRLAEWQKREIEGMELSHEDRILADQLAREESGRLLIDELRDRLRVTTRSWVGVVRFSAFEVHVVPKLAGENLGLVDLIEFAAGLDSLHRLSAERRLPTEGASLFDLIALLFAEACERLVRGGLLAGYKELEDDLPVLRGRFLASKQVLRRFGRLDRLECRYDEYLTDIPENQILRTALAYCAPRVRHPGVLLRIRRMQTIFAAVCSPAFLDLDRIRRDLVYNRLNDHYREAHSLAWLILDALGVRDLFSAGRSRCFAFLLDMNRLFERFVFLWLRKMLSGTPFRVSSQHSSPTILWDANRNCPYTRVVPDLLVERKTQRHKTLPIDAKYILYDEKPVGTGNIYQLFLYAFAFGKQTQAGTPAALLIYPASEVSAGALRLHVRDATGHTGAEILAIGIHIPTALAEARAGKTGIQGQVILHTISGYLL